jgi:hypothetical protein
MNRMTELPRGMLTQHALMVARGEDEQVVRAEGIGSWL